MRIDFYQLSRDPVPQVVCLLARKVLSMGERLLVVSGDPAQVETVSNALWAQDGAAFLAHGEAGAEHEERQPILLSGNCNAANGAKIAILADGEWREEAKSFDRALLLFGPEQTQAARDLWRVLSADEEQDLHIFKQGENGSWREGK